jgi:hypothetical protein
MAKEKYPLEPLSRLRQARLEGASRELAAAVRARSSAEQARADAQRACERHRQASDDVKSAERAALGRGDLSAADLARAEAWAARVEVEADALSSRVEQARRVESQARESEERARAGTGARAAEARVVSEHEERWREAQRAKAERVDEEASVEAWRSKR